MILLVHSWFAGKEKKSKTAHVTFIRPQRREESSSISTQCYVPHKRAQGKENFDTAAAGLDATDAQCWKFSHFEDFFFSFGRICHENG